MKISLILLHLFISLGLVNCNQKPNPIQEDLLNYINKEIKPLAALEEDAVDAYSSRTGNHFTSDENLLSGLTNEVIPKYSNFIKKLEAVSVKTEEVKNLHSIYIRSAKEQLEAFEMVRTGLKKQSSKIIEDANVKLSNATQGLSKWKDEVKSLSKKHDVTVY